MMRVLRHTTLRNVAFLLIAAPLLLAGCRNELPEVMPDGRIPVRTYLLLISTRQVEHYNWAEEVFEAENPGIDVIIEQFPGSSLKDFEIKLRLRFSSRQAPDLFLVNENVAAELAALDLLAPAPDYIQARVDSASLNEMVRQGARFDGQLYGIVADAVWTALYYNKDAFREAGLDPERPPETWEELMDYAERLTTRSESGQITRAGLFVRKSGFKAGISGKWATFLFSAGGRLFTEDGTRAAFNSPEGRAALELYRDALFESEVDAVGAEGDQQGFGQGRVAMLIREPHVIPWLADNYPDLDYGVAPIPGRDTSLSEAGSYLFAVSADSPNPDAAWRFAEFLTRDSVYARYAIAAGSVPVFRTVAEMPYYDDADEMRVFMEQGAISPGGFPRAFRAMDVLGAYIERFAYGHLTVEETLDRAERDVNAILALNESG
jgi:ABC-type glycerol-3-phosphate transport system substrate-binding protein